MGHACLFVLDSIETNFMIRLLSLMFLIGLTGLGCAKNSGVIPIGPDTYMISRTGSTGFVMPIELKAQALEDANKYCAEKRGKVSLIESELVSALSLDSPGGPRWPSAEIHFTCTLAEGGERPAADLHRPNRKTESDSTASDQSAMPTNEFKKTNDASRRYALVIGNGNYRYAAKLANPTNDAADMSVVLKELGFSVRTLINANQSDMDQAIVDFGRKLAKGDIGLFFYAGHGVQANGENYLIPIDANIQSEPEVRYKSINLGQMLDEMGYARNGMNIVILDACRDNPLPRAYRSAARGLAKVDAPQGTLVGFATSPGSTAQDGAGRNGVYTKHILKHIKEPGIPVEQLFKKVLQGVDAETSHAQTPWISSSFTGDFYFAK